MIPNPNSHAALSKKLKAYASYLREQFDNKVLVRALNDGVVPDYDCKAITCRVAEQDGLVEMLNEAAAAISDAQPSTPCTICVSDGVKDSKAEICLAHYGMAVQGEADAENELRERGV